MFDRMIMMTWNCRQSWPAFALCEEDVKFRNDKWNEKFEGKRVIMWDNANVNFKHKPAASHIQQLTYSSCYGSNCAKGGVSKQLC